MTVPNTPAWTAPTFVNYTTPALDETDLNGIVNQLQQVTTDTRQVEQLLAGGVPVSLGGTGATTASTARSNLGLGDAATHPASDFDAAGTAGTAVSNHVATYPHIPGIIVEANAGAGGATTAETRISFDSSAALGVQVIDDPSNGRARVVLTPTGNATSAGQQVRERFTILGTSNLNDTSPLITLSKPCTVDRIVLTCTSYTGGTLDYAEVDVLINGVSILGPQRARIYGGATRGYAQIPGTRYTISQVPAAVQVVVTQPGTNNTVLTDLTVDMEMTLTATAALDVMANTLAGAAGSAVTTGSSTGLGDALTSVTTSTGSSLVFQNTTGAGITATPTDPGGNARASFMWVNSVQTGSAVCDSYATWTIPGAPLECAFSFHLYAGTAATPSTRVFQFRSAPTGGTVQMSINLLTGTNANKVQLTDSAGAAKWTSSNALPSAYWVRIEGLVNQTTGLAHVRLYASTTASADGSYTLLEESGRIAGNYGSGGIVSAWFGRSGTGTTSASWSGGYSGISLGLEKWLGVQ